MMKINCQPITFGANYYEENDKRFYDVEVKSPKGLHLRPCSEIAKLSQTIPDQFCVLHVDKKGKNVSFDATSSMGLLCAGLKKGTNAVFEATMNCPKEIFDKIAQIFEKED